MLSLLLLLWAKKNNRNSPAGNQNGCRTYESLSLFEFQQVHASNDNNSGIKSVQQQQQHEITLNVIFEPQQLLDQKKPPEKREREKARKKS